MLRVETISFTAHADGTVTADHFPAYTSITPELLVTADPRYLRVGWVGLTIEVLGVDYVVVGQDGEALVLRRVDE
ncbi:hypothetical protein [Streptomyces sp. SDr-06]|uniref:hypothetical protein n=1 Tax=Streptomyces sp. SDr-06 TaxID=2267702 RepID=UPI0011C01C56|nr:hypothetical protein [Streptomyces sp. SDr-06]